MTIQIKTETVCVVGAGYVGLPLSNVLSGSFRVISFDIDESKIEKLSARNGNPNHIFTVDPGLIKEADFVMICVPTPLSKGKRPDMTYIREAAAIIGRNLKKGAVVIVESSVFPGATEELIKPILERESGYLMGRDFSLAYSPERINPGDNEHSVDKVTKIVSACDAETLEKVAALYLRVTPHVFKAKNIRTAEAAKLVENTQRDLNIALVNELSIIFQKMGLNTHDVLDAAATKWNFQRLNPGMVGGYCIPVVPYFLVQKAEEFDYHPQVILAGRTVNDQIPKHIVEMTIKGINDTGKAIKDSKVLIMGCTYKENVSDTRESPVRSVIKELSEYKIEVYGYDPLVSDGERELGIKFIKDLKEAPKMDALILTLVHDDFKLIDHKLILNLLSHDPVIIDVQGFFDVPAYHNRGITYKRL
jgi:UDP-N-acetyl-D-glucosamine/UDP-N-acetyl-D-galactosamine dehydrogenase